MEVILNPNDGANQARVSSDIVNLMNKFQGLKRRRHDRLAKCFYIGGSTRSTTEGCNQFPLLRERRFSLPPSKTTMADEFLRCNVDFG